MAQVELRVNFKAVVDGLNKSLSQVESNIKKSFNSRSLANFNKSITNISKSIQNSGDRISSVGRSLTGLGSVFSGAFIGLSVLNFDAQAKAIAQVEAGLKSTASAAQLTSEELQKAASALQGTTLFGDEEILQDVTSNLLTFTNIAGDEFLRTQQAVVDLAARMGGDLQGASIQLGKALNDPVANLSALSRSGIQFSKDQKELINSLVETGRSAEAQRVILSELEKQFGGSAEAAARAGLGPIKSLKNNLLDVTEAVGGLILNAINPFINKINDLVKRMNDFNPNLLRTAGLLVAFAGAIGPILIGIGSLTTLIGKIMSSKYLLGFIGALKSGAAVVFALKAAIVALVGGLSFLATRLVVNFKSTGNFLDDLNKSFADTKKEAEEGLTSIGKFLGFVTTKTEEENKKQKKSEEDKAKKKKELTEEEKKRLKEEADAFARFKKQIENQVSSLNTSNIESVTDPEELIQIKRDELLEKARQAFSGDELNNAIGTINLKFDLDLESLNVDDRLDQSQGLVDKILGDENNTAVQKVQLLKSEVSELTDILADTKAIDSQDRILSSISNLNKEIESLAPKSLTAFQQIDSSLQTVGLSVNRIASSISNGFLNTIDQVINNSQALDRLRDEYNAISDKDSKEAADKLKQIEDAAKASENAWGKAATKIIEDLARIAVQAAITQAITRAIQGFSGGGAVAPAGASAGNNNQGGFISGPGTSTSDSIPARLSNGEFVVKASSVKALGLDFMNKINSVGNGGSASRLFDGMEAIRNFSKGRTFNEGGFANMQTTSSDQPSVQIINNGTPQKATSVIQESDARGTITRIVLEDLQNDGRISKGVKSSFGLRRNGAR